MSIVFRAIILVSITFKAIVQIKAGRQIRYSWSDPILNRFGPDLQQKFGFWSVWRTFLFDGVIFYSCLYLLIGKWLEINKHVVIRVFLLESHTPVSQTVYANWPPFSRLVSHSAVGCAEPSTKYAVITEAVHNYTFGSSVTYDCLPGHKRVHGSRTINCTNTGLWQGVPLVCEGKSRRPWP